MPKAYCAATPPITHPGTTYRAVQSTGMRILATLLALTLAGCAHGTVSAHRTAQPTEAAPPVRVSQQSTQIATAMQALEARLAQLQQNLQREKRHHATATTAVASSQMGRSAPLLRRVHSAVPVAALPTIPVARPVAVKFVPAAVQPPPTTQPATAQHKVAPGDTLGAIAHRYLGRASRWREVWQANPWLRQPRHLRVGQTLTIPIGVRDQIPTSVTPRQTTPTSGLYTVQAGDSLGSIAHQQWGSAILWKRLWQANPTLSNPDQIRVGQRLVIPAAVTKPQHYLVQQGDSLSRLAMVYLGDAGLWRVLKRLNPDLQPSRLLTPGQRLRLPVGSAPIPHA